MEASYHREETEAAALVNQARHHFP
ncbi:MAG: hypothetical protein RLZZ622_1079, partial [Planctomycetota bacterium]